MTRVSVVLPTYNEREGICSILEDLLSAIRAQGLSPELLVVDDQSPDGTADAVVRRFADEPAVRVHRRRERGLAGAIRAGIELATGDVIVLMDTDGNHDPKQVPALVARLQDADIVVGSRYAHGGDMPTSRFRYWCSLVFTRWASFVLGLNVADCLSGFLCFRRELLSGINRDEVFRGYGDYAIRLLYWARLQRLRLVEVPTVYGLRRGGLSKTSFASVLYQYSRAVIRLRWSGGRTADARSVVDEQL